MFKFSAAGGAHLLIRAGTFSDDMITTGMSFNEEDPFTLLSRSYPVMPGMQ